MYINDVRVFVYKDSVDFCKKHGQPKQRYNHGAYPSVAEEDGYLEVSVDEDGGGEREVYRFPLISVWMNNNKQNKTTIAKATAIVPKRQSAEFQVDSELAKLYDFADKVSIIGGIRRPSGSINSAGSPDCMLAVDRYRKTIRYGAEADPYQATDDEYNNIPIYNSKGHAIKAIVEQLKRSASRTVNLVGMDIVNLNSISNSILEEMSFVEIPDVLCRGVSMWQGDPVKSITGGSSSYSFRNSYSNAINKEVVESFIELLEKEFNTVKEVAA